MRAYRIARAKYIEDLSGEGARRTGGRWNRAGIPMLYLGESRALCIVEVLSHVQVKTLPIDYELAEIEFPDDSIHELTGSDLPKGWDQDPARADSQQLGSKWIVSKQSLVLRVPSAHVVEEHNYLVNPLHPRIGEVQLRAKRSFSFDARLISQ